MLQKEKKVSLRRTGRGRGAGHTQALRRATEGVASAGIAVGEEQDGAFSIGDRVFASRDFAM